MVHSACIAAGPSFLLPIVLFWFARYQNPPDYPTVLDPSLYYLHQQYPNLVPQELGIQTPRVINWLQPAASPVFKKLYGVLPHGAPAGNLTIRVRLGDTPAGSRLRKSVVLMAGSAITPEFDAFFHSYSGAIIGMSAVFAIIAIAIRVLCPRKLASSSFSVKPIWKTRRGRGRGNKRRTAERKSFALVQKEAAALRQQMSDTSKSSPRLSPKMAAQPSPAPRQKRGSEAAAVAQPSPAPQQQLGSKTTKDTVGAHSTNSTSSPPPEVRSRPEVVAPKKLVPLSESKASSQRQDRLARFPVGGPLSARASSPQTFKGGKPSAADRAYAESKAERRRSASEGTSKTHKKKKKKKKHRRSHKEASTPVVHPENAESPHQEDLQAESSTK